MAEERTATYPSMPILHWWNLRNRFAERISDIVPGIITEKYVASVLNIHDSTLRDSVMPCLVACGLMEKNGKTTDRIRRWLDDGKYAEVCREIISDVYPRSLLAAAPDPSRDREAAEKWFLEKTGEPVITVRKMIAFYALLCDADLAKSPAIKGKRKEVVPARTVSALPPRSAAAPRDALSHFASKITVSGAPNLQITFSINITPDTTPEQIDRIFENLARHFAKKQDKGGKE
ncbi:MAG: hypothetical protein AB1921_05685 [Thermodesulfobacteriota bacterium]